ncbi:MAG: hypothetical protein HY019_05260 [Aquabacterium sp.]|uniref:hypothetical protein n=1 Tax=Aquabacterium sp. TaxID=1872578 RepID=UPI0025BC99C4|nr:hypothetical protein [Aquabacterium sp.]MBI3381400.1 hypothetical protein [Aquabacterium sp.]
MHTISIPTRLVGGTLGAIAAAASLLLGTPALASASQASETVIVTASNLATNQLLVYSPAGTLLQALPTQGQGGVGGNAGGVVASHGRVAVVNFGSNNVSVFVRNGWPGGFRLEKVIPTLGSPVSVAFGEDHLYVLTTTQVESHAMNHGGIATTADGSAPLLHADGTAAQVGVIQGELIITEKSNAIETVKLDARGAVSGAASSVTNLPANIDTPLGLATRGNEAYVTIAHADETSLVRHNTVLTTTGSGTQHAPCWLALQGPFLYSANSPSKSVSRYAVYGQHIVQDAAVVAQFTGGPTDIAVRGTLAAVIDAAGAQSRVSVFNVDQDGNFTLRGMATLDSKTTNGVAIVTGD